MKKKFSTVEIVFFSIWPILAAILSLRFPVNAFLSPIVFYGIPALYLSIKMPRTIWKAFVFGLFSIPLMIFIDYIAETTGAWLWPLPHSILPLIFHVVSFEVLLWAFLHFFFAVLFYEYFFDNHRVYRAWSKKSGYFLLLTILSFGLFVGLFFFAPHLLHVPFWYLVLGLVCILPPIIFEETRYPGVFLKVLRAGVYFFYINLVYELTALTVHWWSFPGNQFVGYLSLRGITFPFEEFFFWITLFTISILSYYEYFFDNEHVGH